jgi:parallel beta-helix repeat protein
MLTTLHVDVSDPTCGDGGDNLYCQIQDAEDVAVAGDTIKVAEGTYLPVVIDVDDITIEPATADAQPLVDATDVAFSVDVMAHGVSIRGLEVRNAFRVGFFVWPLQNDNAFTGNTARDNETGFMTFFFSPGERNTFTDNTARDNAFEGFLIAGNDNTVTNNTARGNGRGGFGVGGGTGNTVTNNTAWGNLGEGFSVGSFSGGNTVTGNTAHNNGSNGFRLGGGTAIDNTARDNGGDGFVIQLFNGNFTGNVAQRNGGSGFLVSNSDNNVFTENSSRRNGHYGFEVDAIAMLSNTFDDNDCDNNVLGGDNQGGLIC